MQKIPGGVTALQIQCKHKADMAAKYGNVISSYRTTPHLVKLSRVHRPIIFFLCMKNATIHSRESHMRGPDKPEHGQMADQEPPEREERTPNARQANSPQRCLLCTMGISYMWST